MKKLEEINEDQLRTSYSDNNDPSKASELEITA